MIRISSFILLSFILLWLPLQLSWMAMLFYMLRFGGTEVVVFAILLDWYLQPTWPYLSVIAMVLAVVVPVVQQRLMFYTT